jgi:hypothetical protein
MLAPSDREPEDGGHVVVDTDLTVREPVRPTLLPAAGASSYGVVFGPRARPYTSLSPYMSTWGHEQQS